MAFVQVEDVEILDRDVDLLPEFVLESPQPGQTAAGYALPFSGLAGGGSAFPVALRFEVDGHPLNLMPVAARPANARPSPFNVAAGMLPLPHNFEGSLTVVMNDRSEAAVARVRARHESQPLPDPGLQPMMVTTLGRTGSTWMIQLLSRHPEVIAYPPFRGEVRCATYWADVAAALCEPASYLQSVRTTAAGGDWWLGRGRRLDDPLGDESLEDWVAGGHVEQVMRFCRERLSDFYLRLAPGDKRSPHYFVEKGLPSTQITVLKKLYPGLRELFLVRDFRDMLCSILAYSERKGIPSFGLENATSHEDYVRNHLGPGVTRLFQDWRRRAGDACLVRYEDLITDPRPTLASLLADIGLDAGDESVSSMLAEEPDPSRGQLQHPTSPSAAESVHRWEHDLDPALVPVAEEAFAEALEGFGYSKHGAAAG